MFELDKQNTENTEIPAWTRISAWFSGLSHSSQVTYSGVIKEWCEFLRVDVGSLEAAHAFLKVEGTHAIAFREYLLQRPGQVPRLMRNTERCKEVLPAINNKPRTNNGLQLTAGNATVSKKLACLRKMYRILAPLMLQKVNPFDSTECKPPASKSGQKRPTEMIPFAQVERLLSAPDTSTPKGIRDHAVLCILLAGGCRRGEVRNLLLADVKSTELGTMYLDLRATKGKKDSKQPLPQWAANAVHKLFILRLDQGAKPTDPLINSYVGYGGAIATNNCLSPKGFNDLFALYTKKAGIEAWCTPHSARATAITKLLQDGVGHREVQEFSRHAHISMVEVYDKRQFSVEKNPGLSLDFSFPSDE